MRIETSMSRMTGRQALMEVLQIEVNEIQSRLSTSIENELLNEIQMEKPNMNTNSISSVIIYLFYNIDLKVEINI